MISISTKTVPSPMLFSVLTVACGAEQSWQSPPTAPVVGTALKAPPPPAAIESRANPSDSNNVAISEEIVEACDIPEEDAFFAFDSARIRTRDEPVLDAVAACFFDGPLRGRSMHLVGHCDPRGDFEYNMVLGELRADSVKDYIETRGLSASQMQTTSRGEMDAIGYNEATWARDRRVDVTLAPRRQAADTEMEPAASQPS